MDKNERVEKLVEWATSHGATLHPSIQIYHNVDTGLSFRVKPNSTSLPSWETVVSLPTSLTLSYLNAVAPSTSSDQAFHQDFIGQTPPHVVGRLFLVRQYLLGKESFWWPFIQALPLPDNEDDWVLPPFWPADEAELLEGTNVEVGLEKIRKDVRDEFSHSSELLKIYHRDFAKSVSLRLYQWAYCIFSSRSFRPGLVLSEAEQQNLPHGVKIDDFSVLLPLFDIGNHDMTADVRWDLQQGAQSYCELKVGRQFEPGQQVFNNYSMKTNAELLLGYGFMIPESDNLHNDYTHVRKRADTPTASEEYYISARPMDHPSSILGRYKQEFVITLPPGKTILGAFRHVQPEMAWDIFSTITQGQAAQLIPGSEAEQQQRFFSGNVGEECRPFLEQTVAIIQHKVLQELERLEETDVEVVEGDEDGLTARQRLALEYRKRCRLVLENTLEAMDDGDDILGS